jgi:hypothetical protein
MTNFKSIAGASVWMLVSTLLMLAALEPVSMANSSTQASAPAVAHNAAAVTPRA